MYLNVDINVTEVLMAVFRPRRRPTVLDAAYRLDDGGATHSPEATRQMGIAISAAAARTGASINAGDPELLQAIARFIGASGMQRLASGDTAILGLVDRFVGEHAAVIVQHQRERDAQNLARLDAEAPGSGESLTARLLRQGAFGRNADADRAPQGPSGRGDYTGLPGGADVRPADFLTSPHTAMLRTWGMTGDTYNYLYDQGFRMRHIQPAARDVRALGFDVNNRRVMHNGAVIRRDGNDPEETNRRLQAFDAALEGNADFRQAVLDEHNATTPEARDRAAARAREIIERLARESGVTEDIARQRADTARQAIADQARAVEEQRRARILANAPSTVVTSEAARTATTDTADAQAALAAIRARLAARGIPQPPPPGPAAPPPAAEQPPHRPSSADPAP